MEEEDIPGTRFAEEKMRGNPLLGRQGGRKEYREPAFMSRETWDSRTLRQSRVLRGTKWLAVI